MLPKAPIIFVLLFSASAYADELSDDTESRHDRAAQESESDSDSSSDWHEPLDYDSSGQDYASVEPPSISQGEMLLNAFVSFDQMQGTAGGEIVHQDGIGGGLVLELTFFVESTDEASFGWTFLFGYAAAHLLDDYRPIGASYYSNLTLHTIEVDAGPSWMKRFLGIELTYGVGFGFALTAATEVFSDGYYLDEILVLGLRARPHVRIAPDQPVFWGRPFFEAGVAVSAGYENPHLEEYDSLISGLAAVMATPYLRAGHLFSVSKHSMVGLNYQWELIGGEVQPTSMTHKILLILRIYGDLARG